MKNSRLLTIFIIVFVDLLGFSLILPLLPYYAVKYGASPFVVGLLVASFLAPSPSATFRASPYGPRL